jgi:ABC-type uncharacterized transport system substrate-binding protein
MLRKTLLALCLVVSICSSALSFAAEAQSPTKVYRIGWLAPFEAATVLPGGGNRGIFIRTLSDLGYAEGRNLIIDLRYAERKDDRLPALAAELVALKPDVIVALTTPGTKAARQATTTIPIVIVQVGDPVGSGFVASLARPGGNITGVTDISLDLAAKYVELAHALAPKATRFGFLMTDNPLNPAALKATQDAATATGLTVLPVMDRSDVELEQAFASLAKEKVGALIVPGGGLAGAQAEKIADLAARAKLPALYPDRYYVTKGGLLSYGPSYPQMFKTAATYVDKIFKGAKPGDLPIEQPTKFELVINIKTAKALGLTIPQSLRLRADEVIE